MSLSRKLPRTDEGRMTAQDLGIGKKNNTAPADIVFSANTIARLDILQPKFKLKMQARDVALSIQAISTKTKDAAMGIARNYISDYIQTFNAGIGRGIFLKEDRPYFHLDINSSAVPPLTTEAAVIEAGKWIIDGDPLRVAAGGAAMAMPTTAEVSAKYTIFINSVNDQSTKKDAYDTAQEAVQALRPEADALILRMWNEVETAFDNEAIESRRRNAREWGVFYVSTTKSLITGTVINKETGDVLPNVTVTLIEVDDVVTTDEGGNYRLSTGYVGTGTLAFSLEAYVPQTFTVEVTDECEINQNVKMLKV